MLYISVAVACAFCLPPVGSVKEAPHDFFEFPDLQGFSFEGQKTGLLPSIVLGGCKSSC